MSFGKFAGKVVDRALVIDSVVELLQPNVPTAGKLFKIQHIGSNGVFSTDYSFEDSFSDRLLLNGGLPLGKIPLVLVHGIQLGCDGNAEAYKATWEQFIKFFFSSQGHELRARYQLYTFSYQTDYHIEDNGRFLANDLKVTFGNVPTVIVAHSMGGLVTRSAMVQHAGIGAQIGGVITLGTPHHGTKVVNDIAGGVDHACVLATGSPGADDLAWDNFDDLSKACDNSFLCGTAGINTLDTASNFTKYIPYAGVWDPSSLHCVMDSVGSGIPALVLDTIAFGMCSGADILKIAGYSSDGMVPEVSARFKDPSHFIGGPYLDPWYAKLRTYQGINHATIHDDPKIFTQNPDGSTGGLVQDLLDFYGSLLPPAALADTTAPSNTTASNFINSGASSTTSTSVTLAISANDAVGVTAYYVSETSITPSASASGWTAIAATTSYSASVPFTLSSTNGTKTVYVWFKDAAGNVSLSVNDSINLSTVVVDTTAPSNTTPSNFINSGASSTSSTSVTLGISATDAVGVAAYYVSETSTTPSASASGWTAITATTSYSASVSVTLSSSNGTKTVYVWFKDAAGDVSLSVNDSINLSTVAVDTILPQVAITSPGASGTTVNVSSSPLTISGTASDNVGVTQVSWTNDRGGSGVASGTTSWSVSGITLLSGSNTITVKAYDAAGNWNLANLIVNYTYTAVDTTPPTVSSTSPANTTTAVAVNTAITATFSETMTASTVSAATFTLNNGVTGAVTYSGTTATFTPSSNLAYSTTYTATITTGVKDSAGNAMASNNSWTFTTASAPGTAPSAPTGVSATPGNSQATISWNSVSGAVSYNLYWSMTTGVTKTNGTKLANMVSPQLLTATNGYTYYFVVTAVNSYGESSESSQVFATPLASGIAPISLNQALFQVNTTNYVYGLPPAIPNIPISGAPTDTDGSRWSMLYDGLNYRLYFFKFGTNDTLYQFAYNPITGRYEYGYNSIGVLKIVGSSGGAIPADADPSSIGMLYDIGTPAATYRLYMRSKINPAQLYQFAWNGSTYEYGFNHSIPILHITNGPADTDYNRWAMLYDALTSTYRYYAFQKGSNTVFYQFAFNIVTQNYEYGFNSIPILNLVSMPTNSNTNSFSMVYADSYYHLYFQTK